MLFRHIGHAEFLIETESGWRIVTDPYDAGTGYPVKQVEADTVLVSHHHHDHDAVENVGGQPQVIDYAGEHTLMPGVKLTALRAFHDDAGGSKRGETLLFLLEAEGLRVAHLSDLGCGLDEEQKAVLQGVDVLMIPVGGFFTINGDQAFVIAAELEAKTVLPMHYKTGYNSGWPISDAEPFLSHYAEEDIYRGGILRGSSVMYFLYICPDDRSQAHGAWVTGRIKDTPSQVMRSQLRTGFADHIDFRMGSGIMAAEHGIRCDKDPAVRHDYSRAEGASFSFR